MDPDQAQHFVGPIWVQTVCKGYQQTRVKITVFLCLQEKEKQSGVKGQQKAGPAEKSGPVSKTPVRGFFSQYVPRPGEQYYRDLAGNIKRVGFSLNFSPPENPL